MFIKVLKLLSFALFSTILTGCSVSNLDLEHKDNTKTTIVDLGKDRKFQINDSTKGYSHSSSRSLYGNTPSGEMYTSSGVCESLLYIKFPRLEGNMYYSAFPKDVVASVFKDSTCNTNIIEGLEFHSCEKGYAVTYESSNEEGFRVEQKYLFMVNKKCFDEIKKVALQKS